MKNQKGFTLVELMVVLVVGVIGLGGYIANIVKLIGLIGNDAITTMFIARCVGIFAFPLGAVLGFF